MKYLLELFDTTQGIYDRCLFSSKEEAEKELTYCLNNVLEDFHYVVDWKDTWSFSCTSDRDAVTSMGQITEFDPNPVIAALQEK